MKRKGTGERNGLVAALDKCTRMSFMSGTHPDRLRESGTWDILSSLLKGILQDKHGMRIQLNFLDSN